MDFDNVIQYLSELIELCKYCQEHNLLIDDEMEQLGVSDDPYFFGIDCNKLYSELWARKIQHEFSVAHNTHYQITDIDSCSINLF